MRNGNAEEVGETLSTVHSPFLVLAVRLHRHVHFPRLSRLRSLLFSLLRTSSNRPPGIHKQGQFSARIPGFLLPA